MQLSPHPYWHGLGKECSSEEGFYHLSPSLCHPTVRQPQLAPIRPHTSVQLDSCGVSPSEAAGTPACQLGALPVLRENSIAVC